MPAVDCTIETNGAPELVSALYWFADFGGDPWAVFERPPNGQWVMNAEAGGIFPCPAAAGTIPSQGNGALPADVVKAWGMTYASGCSHVAYPAPPR